MDEPFLKKSYCCRCTNDEDTCKNGHTKCLKIFLEKNNPNREIKYTKQVTYEGDDYESTKYIKTSLLHIACKKGNGDCVNILLKDEHIDPNILNDDEETPLQMICERKTKFNKDIILMLLLQHPRVNINGHHSKYSWSSLTTPFYSYIYNIVYFFECGSEYNLQIIKLFLERNADMTDTKDGTKNIFELICCDHNISITQDVIKLLLESGKVPQSFIKEVQNRFKTNLFKKNILKLINEWEDSALDIKEPSEE